MPIFSFSQQDNEANIIDKEQLTEKISRFEIKPGVSVLFFKGNDGAILIDAGYEQSAEKLKKEIEEEYDSEINYLINTHWHYDHTGGNKILGTNTCIISHPYVKYMLSRDHKQGKKTTDAFPRSAQPDICFTDSMSLYFNGERIQLIHLPGGHTGGDIIVYFTDSKVLAAGDLLFADKFPCVDLNYGGNVDKYLDNLDWLITRFPDDINIVGGHGPVYTKEELTEYREILGETIQIVRNAIEEGNNTETLQKKNILKEYSSFGDGFISEEYWIYTIANSY
jgi:glyoxylase-like metal-dependent hydrolase (beta-lactamase superfamily II)